MLEIAGFIRERVSEVVVPIFVGLTPLFTTVGLYMGDNRGFSKGPIPADRSRFFARIDFEFGEGFIQVNETVSADGQRFAPWPISFNKNGAGVPNEFVNQTINYFSLGQSVDGSSIRLSWSVVHGDRRLFAGPLPTALQRPSFDGSLTVKRLSSKSLEVTYAGDCFPSVEAQLLLPTGRAFRVLGMLNKGPEYGLAIFPDCKVVSAGQLP